MCRNLPRYVFPTIFFLSLDVSPEKQIKITCYFNPKVEKNSTLLDILVIFGSDIFSPHVIFVSSKTGITDKNIDHHGK